MKARKKGKRRKGAKPPPRRELVRKQPPQAGAGPQWTPIRAAEEPLVDVAIFSAQVRKEQLDPSLREAAEAVVQALEHVAAGADAAALEKIGSIPRSSPYAQWRWFVRGLIAHYAGEGQTAEANWSKLDADRRPYRIAAALQLAAGEHVTAPQGATDSVRDAAERVRNSRHQRPVLAAARQLVANAKRVRPRRGDDSEKLFGPDDVSRLMALRDVFRKVEPKFVREFELACVQTCFFQPFADVFQMMTSRIPGPTYDPRWNLCSSLYFDNFSDGRDDFLDYLERYCQTDVPQFKGLQRELANAIVSVIWLKHAGQLMEESTQVFASSRTYAKDIESAFQQAVDAYPANREAHQSRLAYLTGQQENTQLTAKERKAYDDKVLAARKAWVAAIPEESDQRILLIDHFLDEDDLATADTHIGFIAGQRSDNPQVIVLPWKLKLRQSMRLAKQKRNLPLAAEALDEAETLWPSWLPKDWLPFLRAALMMRGGDTARAEQLLAEIRKSGGFSEVTFDALWFGAAQQMNLPADFVRPLRAVVESHAKNAARLSFDDLVNLGATYWDLDRGGIMYRGYRGHGSKFGKELVAKLKRRSTLTANPHCLGACFWVASHGYWMTSNVNAPAAIVRWREIEPLADAVLLRGMLTDSYFYIRVNREAARIQRVRELADKQTDPFYRYFLRSLIEQTDQLKRKANRERGTRNRWMGFGIDDEIDYEEDDDDNDDELDADAELCDCPECRAARGELTSADIDVSSDQLDDDWEDALAAAPPSLQRFLRNLSRQKQLEFIAMMTSLPNNGERALEQFVQFVLAAGADLSDLADFDMDDDEDDDEDDFEADDELDFGNPAAFFSSQPSPATQPPMTAAQKREMRKKRKRPGRTKRKR